MTYTYIVQVDTHDGVRRMNPSRLAKAIYRAIEHATTSDIKGAEVLDYRIGQVTVAVGTPAEIEALKERLNI